MEYWELYDKDRNKLNKTHLRGDTMNPGEYYLVVSGWIINDENEILLTQRHPEKTFPLTWECTKGAVIVGEDGFTGVLREIEEEIGIKLKKGKGKLIDSYIGNDFIKDIYLFNENINIEETKLQEKEVVNIKWVTLKEFDEMANEGKVGPSAIHDMQKIKEKYQWK
jgi:mutator protein MutT